VSVASVSDLQLNSKNIGRCPDLRGRTCTESSHAPVIDLALSGRYFACRTHCLPVLFGSGTARFIVIDPFGQHFLVDVDNAPLLPASLGNPTQSDYDFAYPPGTIFAIKEPEVSRRHLYGLDDKRWWPGQAKGPDISTFMLAPCILIDCPSDLLVLDRTDDPAKSLPWTGLRSPVDGYSTPRWEFPVTPARELEDWNDLGCNVSAAHIVYLALL